MSESNLNTAKDRFVSLPVIELGKRERGNPLAIYFVYAPNGSVVVKGNSGLVRDYVKEHYPICLHNYTFWRFGKSRGGWSGNGIFVHKRIKSSKNLQEFMIDSFRESEERYNQIFRNAPKSAKFAITGKDCDYSKALFYRRLPKKWLTEWNKLIVSPTEGKQLELNL